MRRQPDQRPVPARNPGAASTAAQDAAPDGGLDLLALYEAHRERILRYCLALLKHPADAEDAAQETFARAANQVARLEGDAAAYLTTVARNVCCDVVRHRTRKGTRDLDSVVVIDDRVGPERTAVASELAKQLWGHLNSDERTFLAHSFAGFRYEEIAERTGRSVPAVSVSICRARQRLRQLSSALGAAAVLPFLAQRAIDRLWRRGADAAGNAASAVAALDPTMVAAVILGTMGTVTNAIGSTVGPGPRPGAATESTAAQAPFSSSDRAASVATHAPLVVAEEGGGPNSPAAPAAHSPSAAGLTPGIPGSNASPEDVQFTSISASPNYESDRTAYASGSDLRTCPSGQVCPVLFSTHDGGSTWTQRGGAGFSGGALMIPGGYPHDATIFVAGSQGLLASADGGDHFSLVTQLAGPSAVAPGSAPGAARVAIVQGTIWLYQQATGRATAGPALPAGVIPESAMYASPDVLLVVAQQYEVLPSPRRVPAIVRCDSSTCSTVASFPEDADVHLAADPSASALLAYSASRLYRSTDLGSTFTTVLDAGAGRITAVATTGLAGGMVRTVVAELAPGGAPGLSMGDPSTGRWTALPTTLLTSGVTAIAPFGDGRIAVAVTLGTQGGYGLRCLAGVTSGWRPSC